MRAPCICLLIIAAVVLSGGFASVNAGDARSDRKPEFLTSDRCVACHNQLTTPDGKDVSIGVDWRSSIMANSARDPYWQGSVRRETIDHPSRKADIEDECSICHMPITRYEAKVRGEKGKIFDFLPFTANKRDADKAQDGVTCSVCHQISKERLGTRESFTGNFVIEAPSDPKSRPEYGPFAITEGHKKIMNSSTGGFLPMAADHIRDSALCGSCHQLYTTALGKNGEEIGSLPEQVPYLEWLHSDYPGKYSCQRCHMPEVTQPTPVTAILGQPRDGLHRHVFVGDNFFMQRLLNQYRDELGVQALPQELTAAAADTLNFLQTQAARVTIRSVEVTGGRLRAEVSIENLTGHKLPTAYPSRRAWIHFVVRDRDGKVVFESGALNRDGSIVGNDNDADPRRYEPYYSEITSNDQVEIFEPILKDSDGQVTTGLLSAVGYLKDSRLLPSGFDKQTAISDIAVIGDALQDPNFKGGGTTVRYSVPIGAASGPLSVQAELYYQPIGFRWAHNLDPYDAMEPQRFVRYYNSMSETTATVLARAEVER